MKIFINLLLVKWVMTKLKNEVFSLSDIVRENNTVFLDTSIFVGIIQFRDYSIYSTEKLDDILKVAFEFTSDLNKLIQKNHNIWITQSIYQKISKLYHASGFYSRFSSFNFKTESQKEQQKQILRNYSSFLSMLSSRRFPLNKNEINRFYQNISSRNLPKKISYPDIELFLTSASSNSTLVTRDKDYLRLINLYDEDDVYHFFNPGKRLTQGIYVPQNFSDFFPTSYVNRI